MKITLKDIARELGVNVSTVSRAINGKPGVSEELRKKILEFAKMKGYSPDLAAVGLRKGKTKIIGVLIPDISNPFFAQILHGMERVFYPLGYHVLLCSTDENVEKEEDNLRTLLSQRVAGILSAPTDSGGNRSTYKKILDMQIPLVFFDRIIPGLEASYVITDNEGGVAELVRYLYGKGHRSLGIITLRSRSYTGKMRLSGVIKTCNELGILVEEEWILDGRSTQEGAYQAAKKFFQLRDRPTALLVSNNLMMLGVMKAIKELNVKVPEDISIVSFDDSYWNEIFDPPITCVAQEPEQMGLIAATMMMDLLQSGSKPTKTILKAHFIERASVKQIG